MKKIVLLLTILISFPISVYATDSSLFCTYSDSNTKISCQILIINNNYKVKKITGNYVFDNNLEFLDFSIPTMYSGTYNKENNSFTIELDPLEENPTIAVGTITFKVINQSDAYMMDINNIKIYDDFDNIYSIKATKVSLTEGGGSIIYTDERKVIINIVTTSAPHKQTTHPIIKDNTLDELSIDGYKIFFYRLKNDYEITVQPETTNLNVNYKLTNPKYKVKITGDKNLVPGENIVKIDVTDNNNNTNTYTIKAVKGNTKFDEDASLKDLKINKYDISFDKKVKDYYIYISHLDNELQINPTPEKPTTIYQILNNKNLKHGQVIKIKTTAQNGKSEEYTITVYEQLEVIKNGLSYVALLTFMTGSSILTIKAYKTLKKNKIKPCI